MVEKQRYEEALDYLNKGQNLEPSNPQFTIEKGHVHVKLGKYKEALGLYNQATVLGPHLDGHRKALALRGIGFALIEMKDLDNAEQAFRDSLEIEPENELAHNEINYIQQIRAEIPVSNETFTIRSKPPDTTRCTLCHSILQKRYIRQDGNGNTISLCDGCYDKSIA